MTIAFNNGNGSVGWDVNWITHHLAVVYATAFAERYGFGYPDADAEVWGLGYATFWGAAK